MSSLPPTALPAYPTFDARAASPWQGQDILSVKQFSREDLAYVFRVAHEMRNLVLRIGSFDLCRGKILANLFYEPSTRTSSSFAAAMERLGGSVISINEVRYSSVAKGESLPDTVRTLESYADLVVLRHPQQGSVALAAKYARKPVINAGDGVGEHPTQALLDLFTIVEEKGEVDGLNVTMLGDLRFGRTVHSLARLLSMYDVRLRLVAPKILPMPAEILDELREAGVTVTEHHSLDEVLGDTDVLYATRVQKERFDDPAEYESVRGSYVITPETMSRAPQDMILMHPFPRVGEIAMEVDDDPRAAYFRQIEYGLYVRMALVAMVLGRA
ncbi:MAG: aspartate carbamoyltransferase [Alphaproteobacteria bacterium]|nr:aspartate carbamoyltransferase [Alphaproteobacteria bacterium]